MTTSASGSILIVTSPAGQRPDLSTVTGSIPVIIPHAIWCPGAATARWPRRSDNSGAIRRASSPLASSPSLRVCSMAPHPTSCPWRSSMVAASPTSSAHSCSPCSTARSSPRGSSARPCNSVSLALQCCAPARVAAIGVATVVVLVPGPVADDRRHDLWGLGSGVGWPITISAAADRLEIAARDVATVSPSATPR